MKGGELLSEIKYLCHKLTEAHKRVPKTIASNIPIKNTGQQLRIDFTMASIPVFAFLTMYTDPGLATTCAKLWSWKVVISFLPPTGNAKCTWVPIEFFRSYSLRLNGYVPSFVRSKYNVVLDPAHVPQTEEKILDNSSGKTPVKDPLRPENTYGFCGYQREYIIDGQLQVPIGKKVEMFHTQTAFRTL